MTVIHKICNTKLKPSGIGDFGYCPTCKKYVHHLIWTGDMKEGCPYPSFSNEVRFYF